MDKHSPPSTPDTHEPDFHEPDFHEPRPRNPLQRLYAAFESPGRRRALHLAIIAILIVTPWISSQYTTVILTNALLYVVLCLGLNIVVGYAGLLDLGYAAFFAVGAYTVGILTQQFGVNFWAAIPFALMAAALAGIIIGGPTLRLRSDYLAIVTLGFGEIVRFTARNLEITGGASGLSHIPEPSLFGWHIDSSIDFYYVFVVLAVLAYIASQRLFDSRLGRAWLYVRHDEDAAEAMGINRVATKLAAYIIGAIFGAIGGIFFSVNLGAISPESFSFQQSVLILLAVVLGGMGKIPGVILGAFIVVLGPELLRDFGTLRLLIFAVLLLLIMLFRPSGIWPEKRS
ncbi:branched-chain amino acid ABC transporter permease [Salinicola salarius]|jgi:branched-chain amino acid transport system permease protein|uniref:branched-chain amino acid ABC transporter permease n=1 Tax=Salinicola salarius TaxID=430457 RepID=UPI0023E3C153|nr:branched-chain amino acid ABC transporter permease [Salinicola salarius]MDF3918311.1 branched-chain amino acid ABC transporter permease [Salinicola salarius]